MAESVRPSMGDSSVSPEAGAGSSASPGVGEFRKARADRSKRLHADLDAAGECLLRDLKRKGIPAGEALALVRDDMAFRSKLRGRHG